MWRCGFFLPSVVVSERRHAATFGYIIAAVRETRVSIGEFGVYGECLPPRNHRSCSRPVWCTQSVGASQYCGGGEPFATSRALMQVPVLKYCGGARALRAERSQNRLEVLTALVGLSGRGTSASSHRNITMSTERLVAAGWHKCRNHAFRRGGGHPPESRWSFSMMRQDESWPRSERVAEAWGVLADCSTRYLNDEFASYA